MNCAAASLPRFPNFDWLAEAVSDPSYEISLGAFGAVGQFPDEPRTHVEVGPDRIVAETATARIALNHHDSLRPIAFETLSSDPEGWNHGIALCLPNSDALMSGRTLFTSIGPDTDAIDGSERGMCRYDLGLGTAYADICIRPLSGSAHHFSAMVGEKIAANALDGRFPDCIWVFETSLGRIEARHPRRRHIFPQLLSTDLNHSTAMPIAAGFVPAAYVFPPNPRRARNVEDSYSAFQGLFDRFGDPDLVRCKRTVERAIEQDRHPKEVNALLNLSGALSRAELACIRITLRQRRWLRGERDRPGWEDAYDRPLAEISVSPSPSDNSEKPAGGTTVGLGAIPTV
ncbi:MAG: hypothetical protein J0I79_34450 [Mesorhizobium sp.]|uniref:DUF6925 family protein n=1 Tax=Mesorhizobium sp. TaxID=1871066 RepID=UPI001ACE20B2|nr:hypothetical protein [Mesorhizobium sp.]MBN9223056.1 hypothetical protein [Mesorhizobium sp.]